LAAVLRQDTGEAVGNANVKEDSAAPLAA
jgi:hypothetical protein